MRLKTHFARFMVASFCALALLLTGATPESAAASSRAGTYVGQLEGMIDLIGIHVTQADAQNRRVVRAYLCDGEPGGDARWYSGVMTGNKARLESTDGQTTLEVKLGRDAATGSLIFPDGSVRGFVAPPAVGGSGVYEIEVAAGGVMRGVSLAGDTLIATKSPETVSDIGDGRPFEVTVTTAGGETFQYLSHDLNSMSVEELEQYGFPTSYATGGIPPDLYTNIWLVGDVPSVPAARGFGCGRSGDVKRGQPGTNVFGIFDPSF
jgi:hypothetical protein